MNNVKKMRRGFTMIELVFVIVIIGILAAVAIPRLAATRDDAKLVICEHETTMFIEQIMNHYTSQGAFGTISEMTNFSTANGAQGFTADSNLSGRGATAIYKCDGINAVDFNATAGVVTVSSNEDASKGVAKLLKDRHTAADFYKSYRAGGLGIKY